MLEDPAFAHVHFDLSWDEVAKYVVSSPQALAKTVDVVHRHAERFLYGSDEVAPVEQAAYLRVFELYAPLWKALSPEASEKVRQGNYARLFDAARSKVRAWERAHGK
jgi:hypothetical protein